MTKTPSSANVNVNINVNIKFSQYRRVYTEGENTRSLNLPFQKIISSSVSVWHTDLMALDRSPDLFAHRFYVLVLFFSVLVIPKCSRLSWTALWSTFGRTKKY